MPLVALLTAASAAAFSPRPLIIRTAALRSSTATASATVSLDAAKAQLLEACKASGMGRHMAWRPTVLTEIEALETMNPTPAPLSSPALLSGCCALAQGLNCPL